MRFLLLLAPLVFAGFGLAVERTWMRHREAILDRQLGQERIACAGMELFAAACVLSRRDAELQGEWNSTGQSAWACTTR